MAEFTDHHDTMSFGDHLEELRRRVIYALLAPLPLAIVAFFFREHLIALLLEPLFRVLAYYNLPAQVQTLTPPEMLMTQLKLSIIVAIVASAPWMLWQAWLFIKPGLFAHEKRFVYFLIPGSAILTVAGAALLYFVMLPLMLHVLVMFGSSLQSPSTLLPSAAAPEAPADAAEFDDGRSLPVLEQDPEAAHPGQVWLKMPERALRIAVPSTDDPANLEILSIQIGPPSRLVQQYRVSEYISFVLLLLLGMVLAFQMPLVIVLLGWLGIASTSWLRRQRRYAFLLCAIIAAVITPADVISMLAMLIPLYALYELGILLLVIAPAGAVAEGRFRFGSSDEPNEQSKKSSSSGRSADSPQRSVPRDEEHGGDTDDSGGAR